MSTYWKDRRGELTGRREKCIGMMKIDWRSRQQQLTVNIVYSAFILWRRMDDIKVFWRKNMKTGLHFCSVLACHFYKFYRQTDCRRPMQCQYNPPLVSLTTHSTRKSGPEILDVEVEQRWSSILRWAARQQAETLPYFASFNVLWQITSPAGAVLSGSPLTGRMHPLLPHSQPDPSHRHPVLIFGNTTPVLVVTVCTGGGKQMGF